MERLSAADLMPSSPGSQKILRERAEYFAKEKVKEEAVSQRVYYVLFRLGGSEKYGIPYEYVKEVMQNIAITPLPNTPEFIAGVINRRSALIAVYDLKKIFHLATREENQTTHLIIVNANNITAGLLIDKIEGSCSYIHSMLDTPIASESMTHLNYILGVNNGDTSIINVETILSDPELTKKI